MMKCRACDSKNLFEAIDLGNLPLSLGFVDTEDKNVELFETKMMVCSVCGLGQLTEDVDRERLFSQYSYKTSVSKSFLEHSKLYATEAMDSIDFKDSYVLEIASNDGYMLKYFIEEGIDCIGVEPAKNLSDIAIDAGIPTINAFFGTEIAYKLLEEKGYPALIIANNVMAHVPDIKDFMEGLSIIGKEALITIENPTIMNILQKNHFDTIFHEHYSYLSVNAVEKLAKKFGLTLFDVEQINTQGGSNRYYLHSNPEMISPSVEKIKQYEIENGLFDSSAWEKMYLDLVTKMKDFNYKISSFKELGQTICGYAASSKATIQLNFADIDGNWISCIADDGEEKQGRYLPTKNRNIPIKSLDQMLECKPDHIIIFPWNIQEELEAKLRYKINENVRIWSWIQ